MTSSGNAPTRFNLMQRSIQAVFGTREFAVVFLVVFCAIVEVCILVATQRYEALTAPPGTVLFWGMSAAGMVIFFAEVLKLPVAWISGVVSGKRMLVLNLVTFGLCMLTALTIKDLVIWEWDAALKPAREMRDQANAVATEIDALEHNRTELTQNSEQANALRQTRINGLQKLLDDQVRRRNEDLALFNGRLASLSRDALDPSTRNQIAALEKARDESLATFKADLETLQRQLDSRTIQIAETRAKAQTGAQQNLDKTSEQRQTLRKEYELARERVIQKRDAEIERLGPDGPFTNVGPERVRLRDEAERELKRLESEYKANIEALGGPTPSTVAGEGEAELKTLREQIASKQKDRDQKLDTMAAEIQRLHQKAAKDSAAVSIDLEGKTREIQREMSVKIGAHDVKIREYEDQLSAATAENRALTLTPEQLEAKVQEITAKLPALKQKADSLRAESNRLAKDTNAIRAANGVVRWVLPDASVERLEEVAYGVFPLLIALLVSCLPAILLEIGVYCVRPEVRRAERPRTGLLARLSRSRRILRDLRARTQQRMSAADASLRESKLLQEKLLLEHANRSTAFDKEIDHKIAAAVGDLRTKTDLLESELQASRAREAELSVKLSETTQLLSRASDDVRRLATQVVSLDARVQRST